MNILVVNAGSGTYKCKLFRIDSTGDHPLWEGSLDLSDPKAIHLQAHAADSGLALDRRIDNQSPSEALQILLQTLWSGEKAPLKSLEEIHVVGHRVVHGGAEFSVPVKITENVKEAIRLCIPLAPLHNSANLAGIEMIEKLLPHTPQVAVFDTAFHFHLTPFVFTYPIPLKYREMGIKRYGFHGISHCYCAQRIADLLKKDLESLRIISCHLGNGASLAAIKEGFSVDTTMGFTPMEGVMMGSRCGSIDPGIILALQMHGLDNKALSDLLNDESGLKGIAGSADMRTVEQAALKGIPEALLAIDMYVYRLRYHILGMRSSLDKLDALIFTAGIGENSPHIRAKTCEGLEWMGVVVDPEKNRRIQEGNQEDCDISTPDSPVRIYVIHTREEWAIAQAAYKITKI